MINSYHQLTEELPDLFVGVLHAPKMVIAIDEAHKLSKPRGDLYRPSHILCKVIAAFSRTTHSSWVLFASTTSKVADFSAPSHISE